MIKSPFFQLKRIKITTIAQYGVFIALVLLSISCNQHQAHAADFDLLIYPDGKIIDQYNNKTIGELFRGWGENVLFASLSQEGVLGNSFSVQIKGDGIDLQSVNPKLYAVHGALAQELSTTDGSKYWQVMSSSGSQVTIVAQVPPGTFKDPVVWQIINMLSKIPNHVRLSMSILMPTSLLLYLYFRFKRAYNTKTKSPEIHPDILNVSPAALTVLLRGYVSKRASASTLINLAQRGHIQLLVRENKVILYKRKGKDNLRPHEQAMLERWFKSDWKSSGDQLKREIQTEVINERSKIANLMVYEEVDSYQWFTARPIITHWKILILSFILTMITSFIFFMVFVYLPSANPLLWFLAGAMISIGILYTWEPSITKISQKGKDAIKLLNETKLVLTDNSEIRMSPNNQGAWEHYLALSMVLGVTPIWLSRWKNTPFQQPTWLLTTDPIRDFDDFMTRLRPILEIASESIRDTILPAYV